MGFGIKIDPTDQALSLFIRKRDRYKCQRCGKFYPEGKGLQCSHFVGRACNATRFDPDNCCALDTGCHQYFETHQATYYRDFMIKRLGEQKFKMLEFRARTTLQLGGGDKLLLKKSFEEMTRALPEVETNW